MFVGCHVKCLFVVNVVTHNIRLKTHKIYSFFPEVPRADRQTDRQTDGQADRQTDRHCKGNRNIFT
jgi:hypothetical protein